MSAALPILSLLANGWYGMSPNRSLSGPGNTRRHSITRPATPVGQPRPWRGVPHKATRLARKKESQLHKNPLGAGRAGGGAAPRHRARLRVAGALYLLGPTRFRWRRRWGSGTPAAAARLAAGRSSTPAPPPAPTQKPARASSARRAVLRPQQCHRSRQAAARPRPRLLQASAARRHRSTRRSDSWRTLPPHPPAAPHTAPPRSGLGLPSLQRYSLSRPGRVVAGGGAACAKALVW